MDLAKGVGSLSLGLAVVLVTAYAADEDAAQPARGKVLTIQEKLDAREARRRAEVADQEKRKGEVARRCSTQTMSAAEIEACRAAYRKL